MPLITIDSEDTFADYNKLPYELMSNQKPNGMDTKFVLDYLFSRNGHIHQAVFFEKELYKSKDMDSIISNFNRFLDLEIHAPDSKVAYKLNKENYIKALLDSGVVIKTTVESRETELYLAMNLRGEKFNYNMTRSYNRDMDKDFIKTIQMITCFQQYKKDDQFFSGEGWEKSFKENVDDFYKKLEAGEEVDMSLLEIDTKTPERFSTLCYWVCGLVLTEEDELKYNRRNN